jgi:hypothetical protein
MSFSKPAVQQPTVVSARPSQPMPSGANLSIEQMKQNIDAIELPQTDANGQPKKRAIDIDDPFAPGLDLGPRNKASKGKNVEDMVARMQNVINANPGNLEVSMGDKLDSETLNKLIHTYSQPVASVKPERRPGGRGRPGMVQQREVHGRDVFRLRKSNTGKVSAGSEPTKTISDDARQPCTLRRVHEEQPSNEGTKREQHHYQRARGKPRKDPGIRKALFDARNEK